MFTPQGHKSRTSRLAAQLGHIIVAVNGNRIEDFDDLRNEFEKDRIGETVNLSIVRGDEPIEIMVDLEEVS